MTGDDADRRSLVSDLDEPVRADAFAARHSPEMPRRIVRGWFDAGGVRRQGRRLRKGDEVRPGDVIELPVLPETWLVLEDDPDLDVVLETHEVVVVNKWAGADCHPLAPGEGDTVLDAVCARYPEVERAGPPPESGLCHRLDDMTSGALIFARTPAARMAIRDRFGAHAVDKTYLAITAGAPEEGVIEVPIAHHPTDAARMVAADRTAHRGRPQPARSEVEVIDARGDFAVVRVRTRTGRRHQVRVHLAASGAPLVDDPLYGRVRGEGGFWLHASTLAWEADAGFEGGRVTAPLPDRFAAALMTFGLRLDSP